MDPLRPPPRQFRGDELIVASHNGGKLREIGQLLQPLGIQARSAAEYGLPEPEETGLTFEANAELKALAAATATGLPALADDSGLSVRALGGQPGIYSARWAGPEKDFGAAMERVRRQLEALGTDDFAAAFICALALAWPDGHTETFMGSIGGQLTFPPRGEHGFGYDPIFVADGDDQTFGELDSAEKHRISHRARAFALLLEGCFAP
jgi:XTP/dITP diphosphohydrolase